MSSDYDHYSAGRSGDAPNLNANMTQSAAFLAGQAQRNYEEFVKKQAEQDAHGNFSHEFNLDRIAFIIIGIVLGYITYYVHMNTSLFKWEWWVPWIVGGVGIFTVYFILHFIPNLLRGLMMGSILGGGVGLFVWARTDYLWGIGSGIITGIIMYFIFYFSMRSEQV